MRRLQPNHHLAALLTEADWSAGDLARAVNSLGTAHQMPLRYDRTSVAHWLAGSRPRPPVAQLAADAFTRRLGRLVVVQETRLGPTAPAADPQPAPQRREASAMNQLFTLCREEADPECRAALRSVVYSLGAATQPAWASPPLPSNLPSSSAWLSRTAASAGAVTLQDMTRTFAMLSERHGGAHIRPPLLAYLTESLGPLFAAPAPEPIHRELLTGAAQLTHLLATMTMDAGRPGLAQRYFRTSLNLAREAENRVLYAITLRAMSLQALRLDHPRHAGDLAQAAVDTAPLHTPPAVKAFLLSQRAVTHAHEGWPHLARADLVQAERHHEQADSPAGPFTSYPKAALDYQRGQTFHALGDSQAALAALSAASHRSPVQRRSYALTRAKLAETLLQTGQLEAACVHWHIFLDHYPHLKSVQIEHAFTSLEGELHRFPRQPHARALRERARALSRPHPATPVG